MVVTEPSTAPRGTVVVFSGAGGTYLWGAAVPDSDFDFSRYEQALEEWSRAGLRVVRIQWDENWFQGAGKSEGFAALGIRPATVTTWVAENLVDEGQPLCVGGVSGGAAQVSYMLTHYGLEERISLAVPWSGFWMGRIDIGCLDDDSRNAALHYGEFARRAIDLSYGFPLEEAGPCLSRDQSFRIAFAEASISVGGDYFYPHTLVWHVLAGADEVGGLGQGLTYYEAMLKAGSPHVRADVLPGLPHNLTSEETGISKIRDVFLQECRLR